MYVNHPAYAYARILRNADIEGSGGNDEATAAAALEAAVAAKIAEDAAKAADSADPAKVAFDKAVADAVAALQKKNVEVIGANKKLKDELAAAKAKPGISDEDFAEFTNLKERIARDELLRLMTEGKSEEALAAVTKRTRIEYEAKIAAEAEKSAKITAESDTWRTRYEQTLVNVEVTKATAGAIKPGYQDLMLKLVDGRVKLIDGEVRVVSADGEIEMTANGAHPLTVGEYIESMRPKYGDLFVPSAGGGAGGSGRKPTGTGSTKVSSEVAANAPMDEYIKLRADGRI